MKNELRPIIQPNKLIELKANKQILLIDASSDAEAKKRYIKSHLEGALFVDLNNDLADIKSDLSLGGRHPLPTPADFSKTLTKLGISFNTQVVIYDNQNCSNSAARFWWMLNSAGHKNNHVINGGYQSAVSAGFPISSRIEIPIPTKPFVFENWIWPLSDIENVEKARTDKNFIVIDVRAEERFDGINEPIDIIAGHIPGAINIPFAENLDDSGLFLSPDKLKEKYLRVIKNISPKNAIVHCGSGVTACHTLLAFYYSGLEIPSLYVGSWSEWSRNNREIFTRNN